MWAWRHDCERLARLYELYNFGDAPDLVAQKQHLLGEPQHELVVSGIVFRDEHPPRFLTAEFSNDRQRTIALLGPRAKGASGNSDPPPPLRQARMRWIAARARRS
jgi:hypothetical protein